jgi:hypothetical protein
MQYGTFPSNSNELEAFLPNLPTRYIFFLGTWWAHEMPNNRLRPNFRLLRQRRKRTVAKSRGDAVESIAKYASEIWSFVGGLVAGLAGGSLLTIRFIRKTEVSTGGSNVDRSHASAGGDLVGRDKIAGRDQS